MTYRQYKIPQSVSNVCEWRTTSRMPPKPGITRQSQVDNRIQYLGRGKELAEDELPKVRACLQYEIHLRGQEQDEELSLTIMAKQIYCKVALLYCKAIAKIVPPVIMSEKAAIKKILRYWVDVNMVLRRKKGYQIIQKRIESQLDKLFDIMQCKCEIFCMEVLDCSLVKCSCTWKFRLVRSIAHWTTAHTSRSSPKELKLPKLDLLFLRAQRYKVGEKSAYSMGHVDSGKQGSSRIPLTGKSRIKSVKKTLMRICVRQGACSLTRSARTLPSIQPGLTIWGVKGGSPLFVLAKSFFIFYLERYAKLQNHRQTHSGRMPAVHPEMTI